LRRQYAIQSLPFHQTRTGPAVDVSNALSNSDARSLDRKRFNFAWARDHPTANPVPPPARLVSRFRPRRPRTPC